MFLARQHLLHERVLALISLLVVGLFSSPRVSGQAVASTTATPGQRHITLEGAPNLRDLGGYPTTEGKHVRWKKIYRSGELSRLTPADYQVMAGLGIAVVCDFRRDSERNAAPTKWQGASAPTILNLPGGQGERAAGTAGGGAAGGSTPAGLSPLLVASYPTYVTTLASSFRTVLEQLKTQNGAVLYHCTAGKDRTGSFSALLLTMLGVPKDVVMEDYLLSNQYVVSAARLDAAVARGGSREAALATLGVDRAYLDSLFQTINASYGSFDEYRRTALGVSDADLAALKARLLE